LVIRVIVREDEIFLRLDKRNALPTDIDLSCPAANWFLMSLEHFASCHNHSKRLPETHGGDQCHLQNAARVHHRDCFQRASEVQPPPSS
jgi:hypothetical protein